jgi:hypothetical protein
LKQLSEARLIDEWVTAFELFKLGWCMTDDVDGIAKVCKDTSSDDSNVSVANDGDGHKISL